MSLKKYAGVETRGLVNLHNRRQMSLVGADFGSRILKEDMSSNYTTFTKNNRQSGEASARAGRSNYFLLEISRILSWFHLSQNS